MTSLVPLQTLMDGSTFILKSGSGMSLASLLTLLQLGPVLCVSLHLGYLQQSSFLLRTLSLNSLTFLRIGPSRFHLSMSPFSEILTFHYWIKSFLSFLPVSGSIVEVCQESHQPSPLLIPILIKSLPDKPSSLSEVGLPTLLRELSL